MKIYIMRHGTTVWNETGISQGRSQNRLSENGKRLAEAQAEKFKNTKIDIIYSSPLMRTVQTANIMNKYHNVKIVRDERITEIDQGYFTGKMYSKLTEQEKQWKFERNPKCNMETYQHAYERAKEFIDDIVKNETHENILIVSHNNICSFMNYAINEEIPDYQNFKKINRFENAEIKAFEK